MMDVNSPRWIPPNEHITIQGITIASGGFYAGELRLGGALAHEPSLIDPTLPVQRVRDGYCDRASHWKSYREFGAALRGEMLRWYASGRTFQPVSDLPMRLFLDGVERRMHGDPADPLTWTDLDFIVTELRRLSDSNQFETMRHRIDDLRGVAEVMARSARPERFYNDAPPVERLPSTLFIRTVLGQATADQAAVPAEWALSSLVWDSIESQTLAILWSSPHARQLFGTYFGERWPQGLKLESGRTAAITHVTTNRSLPLAEHTLPVSGIHSFDYRWLIEQVVPIARKTAATMRPFLDASKSIKRPAVALLPPALLTTANAADVVAFVESELGAADHSWIPLADIAVHFPHGAGVSVPLVALKNLASVLSTANIGLACTLLGVPSLAATTKVPFYRTDGIDVTEIRAAVDAISVLVATVGASGARTTPLDMQRLLDRVIEHDRLDDRHAHALQLHVDWLLKNRRVLPPSGYAQLNNHADFQQVLNRLRAWLAVPFWLFTRGEARAVTALFELAGIAPPPVEADFRLDESPSLPNGYSIPPAPPGLVFEDSVLRAMEREDAEVAAILNATRPS